MKIRLAMLAVSLALLSGASITPALAASTGGPTGEWFAFDLFFPSNDMTSSGLNNNYPNNYPNDNYIFLNLNAPVSVPSTVTDIYAIVELHNNSTDGIPNGGGIYLGPPSGTTTISSSGTGYTFDSVEFTAGGIEFLISDPQGSFSLSFPDCPTCTTVDGFFNEPSGFTPSPTPLPAALPLFATGIGGLGFMAWRKKRKARAELVAA